MSEAPILLSTLDKAGNRLWVYPQSIKGFFTKRRAWVAYGLIIFYLGVPWLKYDGLPLIQMDVINRQFIFFGHIFWPQDVKYLVFVLLGAGMSLFFFTSLAGRLWCGWACPQTVFLEFVFRKIETILEGERAQRMAFDKAPWTFQKILRKAFKQLIFLIVAAIVGNTFLAYFAGAETVLAWSTQSPLEHWGEFLFMMANLLLFFLDFSWFREQFCTVVCPYARFQSALTDEHTFQVTYELQRGEPRGKLGKVSGDCIDCGACVRVCPTGIDIRNGSQMECIGCARCIDACDEIMTKIKKPIGLIRYDSDARMLTKQVKIIRPRVIIYSVLLVLILGGLLFSLLVRQIVEVQALRAPGEPFTIIGGQFISNHFTLRIVNKDRKDHNIVVTVSKMEGAQLIVPIHPYPSPANSLNRLEVFVNLPKDKLPSGKQEFLFHFSSDGKEFAKTKSVFLGPMSN